MISLVEAFLVGLGLTLLLTPPGIRVAWATGYLDHPEARKLHTSATALLGGVVVFVCACAAWVLMRGLGSSAAGADIRPVFAGAVLALSLGMWDDRFGMTPVVKLLGQASAGGLLLSGGHVPDLGLHDLVEITLTIVLIVGLMNAVNFLDNMNGMVGGIAAIALGTFAWTSIEHGAWSVAAAQLALAGACLGFLRYNFPRARLFLGDAGSLFLGYSLGASALLAFETAPSGWAKLGPVVVLAYPAFDMIFVVVNRLREGRKIYEGGKDHTNHRLASVLQCQKRTVMLIWAVGAALSVSGLVILKLNQALPVLLLSGLWITLFLLAGLKLSSIPVARPPAPRQDPVGVAASPSPKT